MKKNEENLQEDFEEMGDVYDWDEEGDPDHEVAEGVSGWSLFFILLFCYGVYELIIWLF